MRKIISLFQRNYEGDHLVRDEVVPGAEWVLAGEGVATGKLDGTCCLVRDGCLYRRHEVRPGAIAPGCFEPLETDEKTGKTVGWVPVGEGPADRWHREGFEALRKWELARRFEADEPPGPPSDGTYELLGPKINGNPEGWGTHWLFRHAHAPVLDAPRTYAALKTYLATCPYEGIVWHHSDGRMVKIKTKDFGLRRGAQ